jgi:hypothetical protein
MPWRWIAVIALPLAALPAAAQTAALTEVVKPGDCFEVRLDMKLSGELRIRKDDAPSTVKLSASGQHSFTERFTAHAADGQRSVRYYDVAKASITAGKDTTERSLREKRRLVVAQRHKDARLVYSPTGALTRGELEVAGDHFDTLLLPALLPGKEVKAGEAWSLSAAVAASLCNLEGVTESKLEGKLTKVVVDQAHFTLSGTVSGIEQGAAVKVKAQAEGVFDLRSKRLVKLEWSQEDERDQGPVSPASTMKVSVTMSRKQVEAPEKLNDIALVPVPDGFAPPSAMTHVEHRDDKGRFLLFHAREWQVVAVTEGHTVLRLVERGELVAQATIAPWDKGKGGKPMSMDDFRTAVNTTSGWRPEREVQADKIPSSDGKTIYRLSVLGQLDGVAVLQTFFLVANGGGDQVVITFTMPPKNADKLGARDLSLAGSLELPAPAEKK